MGSPGGGLPAGVLKVVSLTVPMFSSEKQRLAPGKLAIVLPRRNP